MADLRYCSARMYDLVCELRYDHEGDHRQGHLTWERIRPGESANRNTPGESGT